MQCYRYGFLKTNIMNIQDELQKIHHKYGTTEKANYEIQKLFDNEILPYKIKSAKWDKLGDKIGKYYESENESIEEEEGSLLDIGEAACIAYGYI